MLHRTSRCRTQRFIAAAHFTFLQTNQRFSTENLSLYLQIDVRFQQEQTLR